METMKLALFLTLWLFLAHAQSNVLTFQYTAGQASYTLLGSDPAKAETTKIPTVLVPITLTFKGKKAMDASQDVPSVLRSPVFANFAFPSGGNTQYADALLRAMFPKSGTWHTLLGKPEVKLTTAAPNSGTTTISSVSLRTPYASKPSHVRRNGPGSRMVGPV
jgi:hypothetical protein